MSRYSVTRSWYAVTNRGRSATRLGSGGSGLVPRWSRMASHTASLPRIHSSCAGGGGHGQEEGWWSGLGGRVSQ